MGAYKTSAGLRLGIFTAGFRWSGSSALSDWLESFSSVRKPPGCKAANDEIRALNYGLTLLVKQVEKTRLYSEQLSRYSMFPDKSRWNTVFGRPLTADKGALSQVIKLADSLFMAAAKGRLNPGIDSYGPLLSTSLGRDYRDDREYIEALHTLNEAARHVITKHPGRRSWETISADREFSAAVSGFFALFYDRLSQSGAVPVFDNAFSALNPRYFDLVESNAFPRQLIMLVKRDPRDQFAELVKYSTKTFSFMVRGFIRDYKKIVTGAVNYVDTTAADSRASSGKVIKLIDFEDFVYDSSGIRSEIESRLSDMLTDFSYPADFNPHFYDPEKSKPNIGLWKKSGLKREMNLIINSLPEYLRPEAD